MNVSVPTSNLRRIEVLAQDLPCAQLVVDVSLRSALSPGPQKRMAAMKTVDFIWRITALVWEHRWTSMLSTV